MSADDLEGDGLDQAVKRAYLERVELELGTVVFEWGPQGAGVDLMVSLSFTGASLGVACSPTSGTGGTGLWKFTDAVNSSRLVAIAHLAPPPPATEAFAWRTRTVEFLTGQVADNNAAIDRHNREVKQVAEACADTRRQYLAELCAYHEAFGEPTL